MSLTSGLGSAVCALTLAAALTACSAFSSGSAPVGEGKTVSMVSGACPVTKPTRHSPFAHQHFNYRNRTIGVALWPNGHLIAGRLPGGGSYARVMADGSIVAKL